MLLPSNWPLTSILDILDYCAFLFTWHTPHSCHNFCPAAINSPPKKMVTKRHFPQKKNSQVASLSRSFLQGLLPARSACSGDRSHGSGAVRHLRLLARICVPRLQRGGFGELDIPHKLRCLHPKPTGRSHSWPIYCFSKMIMETNSNQCIHML